MQIDKCWSIFLGWTGFRAGLDSAILCCVDVREVGVEFSPVDAIVQPSSREWSVQSKFSIRGPCIVGKNCKIDKSARIGPNASIGDDTIISSDVVIENSIIMSGCKIERGLNIKDSIISANCHLHGSIVDGVSKRTYKDYLLGEGEEVAL